MEKDLLEGTIGTNGSYDLRLAGSSAIVNAAYKVGVIGAKIELAISVKDLLLLLKDKIPGKIDDAVIDFVVAELEK